MQPNALPLELEGFGGPAWEAAARETGRGLVEHLDEVGNQHGQAELIRRLVELKIRYQDQSRGRGSVHGFRAKSLCR